MDEIVLRFQFMGKEVDLMIDDVDKVMWIDLINEYEDAFRKKKVCLDIEETWLDVQNYYNENPRGKDEKKPKKLTPRREKTNDTIATPFDIPIISQITSFSNAPVVQHMQCQCFTIKELKHFNPFSQKKIPKTTTVIQKIVPQTIDVGLDDLDARDGTVDVGVKIAEGSAISVKKLKKNVVDPVESEDEVGDPLHSDKGERRKSGEDLEVQILEVVGNDDGEVEEREESG
uniref:Uncharacterized protein n=1 Tax=Chenopodium quinoa TaxID=63459 RepID=A0A803M677_CHEQI